MPSDIDSALRKSNLHTGINVATFWGGTIGGWFVGKKYGYPWTGLFLGWTASRVISYLSYWAMFNDAEAAALRRHGWNAWRQAFGQKLLSESEFQQDSKRNWVIPVGIGLVPSSLVNQGRTAAELWATNPPPAPTLPPPGETAVQEGVAVQIQQADTPAEVAFLEQKVEAAVAGTDDEFTVY